MKELDYLFNFVKLLVIGLIGYNIVSNLISLRIAIQTMISRIFSYKDQKAKKAQIEKCQKIMNSAMTKIDFLKNFDVTTTGSFHSEDDEIEQMSWCVKVQPNPTQPNPTIVSLQVKFFGSNLPPRELGFEATNPKELQWLIKLKIQDQEMCEIQAFDEFTRSLNDISNPVLNLSVCFFVSTFF